MNKVKVSLIIKSHLNDAMVEMGIQQEVYQQQAQERLRFVKYLVHMFPDTNTKVYLDTVYEQFKLKDNK